MAITAPTITLPASHVGVLVRALDSYRGDAALPEHTVLDLRTTLTTAAQSDSANVALTPASARTAEALLSAALLHAKKKSWETYEATRSLMHSARRFGNAQTFASVHAQHQLMLPPGDIKGSDIAHIARGMIQQLSGEIAATDNNSVHHALTLITTLLVPLAQELVDRIDALAVSASKEFCALIDRALDFAEAYPRQVKLDEHARAALYNAAFHLHGKKHLFDSARELCGHWFNDDETRLALALFSRNDGTRLRRLARMLMGFDTVYEHGSSVVTLGHAAHALHIADHRKSSTDAERALAVINSINVQHDDPLAEHARLSLILEAVRVARHHVRNDPEKTGFTLEQLDLFQDQASEGLRKLKSALMRSSELIPPSPPQKPRPPSPSPDGARTSLPSASAEDYPPDRPDPQSA